MKTKVVFSFLILALLVCGKMVHAQDAAKVAPDKVKVLLDNDKVPHNNENVGKTEIRALVIELKTPMIK